MDQRAQISAELMIVLAAVAALALFLIDQLNTTAKEMGETLSDTTSKIQSKIQDLEGTVE